MSEPLVLINLFSMPAGQRDNAGQADGGWDVVSAHPALYSVVHVTPDPTASSGAHS
ncbi:hypothetical protein Aple_087170 [Acrocarpospora pleiomorpha]|uniref:Uncharacterized protein n=1 Tax=Acrocarpospora pleiomorpha TaxID=90975 RepID=A0A5M3Y4C7_9ACTN|nr:hypothetical protein [Acrocarpospora pleiomorpha]GES25818.1 hypothetical protein Aple_087170 [Acrocarpospora pleiomorpha]